MQELGGPSSVTSSRRAGVDQSSCEKFISWGFIPTSKVWPELLSQVLYPFCVHNFSCPQVVKTSKITKATYTLGALEKNSHLGQHQAAQPWVQTAGPTTPKYPLLQDMGLYGHFVQNSAWCHIHITLVTHSSTLFFTMELIFPPQAPEDLRNLPRLGLSQSHQKKCLPYPILRCYRWEGGFRMGNTCKSMADSRQRMAETTTIL